jgi:hypothetical protein
MMDKFVEIFLSWQILALSFCTFIVLSTIKRLGTKKKDGKVVGGFAHHKVWKSLQPVFPYPVSVGICFIPGIPLPELVAASLATKIMFGMISGWLADKVFQIVKGALEKAGVKFPEKE